jgi:hypothetical protein
MEIKLAFKHVYRKYLRKKISGCQNRIDYAAQSYPLETLRIASEMSKNLLPFSSLEAETSSFFYTIISQEF